MSMFKNNMDFVYQFERLLATYTGFKYAITTDCCTNAILVSCEAKVRTYELDHDTTLLIPKHTYMSVPMTLKNNGWKIQFVNDKWYGKYMLGIDSQIYDAATDLHKNMVQDYAHCYNPFVCVSFQQKKRLPLGKGGVILFNDKKYFDLLRRLVYDGRNAYLPDSEEIARSPNNIICGYHCYMEPDKAAKGILLLNQEQQLAPYMTHSYAEYPDISELPIWK